MQDLHSRPYRRGTCPGVGSSMSTGDGLLSRVRVPGGRLQAKHLAFIATLAAQHGQAVLELTRRGNLQLRGLAPETDASVSAALIAQGLAVAPAEAEASRNTLSSPAADLDPYALADPWPLALALDKAMVKDTAFRALPTKFRLLLNGGGVAHLAAEDADIRADAIMSPNGLRYRLSVAGTAYSSKRLGLCAPEHTVKALLALTHHFIERNSALPTPGRRLLHVLGEVPLHEFQAVVAPWLQPSDTPFATNPSLGPDPGTVIGAQNGWFGAGVPFGELSAETAQALADLAETHAAGQLRLTPWRQILLPGAGAELAGALNSLGLITEPDDARLSATACPGAPACNSGSSSTRTDALGWARAVPALFDGELTIHISGCGKGCAHPLTNPLTLTARAGLYDLIVNDRADPAHEVNTVLTGLTPADVEARLQLLSRILHKARQADETLSQLIMRLDARLLRQALLADASVA